MDVFLGNQLIIQSPDPLMIHEVSSLINFPEKDYYILNNGKLVCKDGPALYGKVEIVLRLVGGKGGFGSMLRAIGAQIEKTTNREACRDLSGRRLRDINEEKRLKSWIAAQTDREREAKTKKRKKLERLLEQPKHEFKDEDYDKVRSDLPEKLEDAVTQGLQASCSTKRKLDDPKPIQKKKPKLWINEELDSSGTDSESDNETETQIVKTIQ